MSLKAWFRYGQTVGRGDRQVTARQTQTVLTVVVLGIIIALGLIIYSEVFEVAFPNADSDTANNTVLQNAASNSTTTFGDSMELAPVIMIVLIAAVILGVVQRFR